MMKWTNMSNDQDKVGCIFPSILPYYDKEKKKMLFKSRPVLILKMPQFPDTEVVVLPISTLLNKKYKEPYYDILLDPQIMHKLYLTRPSYVRVHKQTIIYYENIDFCKCLGNLKQDYDAVFAMLMQRLESYQKEILKNIKIFGYF